MRDEYARCLARERDRYREWAKSRQGRFETYRILHFDAQTEECLERENSTSWLTDRGRGAAVIRRCGRPGIAAWQAKRALAALARARRVSPALARTLRLILANGDNRRETIWRLAGRSTQTKVWHQAEARYYRHRAKLLALFNA